MELTNFGPDESEMGRSASFGDSGHVLERMFDGISLRGFSRESVEALAHPSGVPEWNGLTDQPHPTQMPGEILTICAHKLKPPSTDSLWTLGDGPSNRADSMVAMGALLGLETPIADHADAALGRSPGSVCNVRGPVQCMDHDRFRWLRGVGRRPFPRFGDWMSKGESAGERDERMDLHSPFWINAKVMSVTGNPEVNPMHRLSSLQDANTEVAGRIGRAWLPSWRSPTMSSGRNRRSFSISQKTGSTPSKRSWCPQSGCEEIARRGQRWQQGTPEA